MHKLFKVHRRYFLSHLPPSNPPRQLHIFRHDCNPLGMDGTQIGIFKKTNQEGFGGLLHSQQRLRLEPEVFFVVLGHLLDEPLKGPLQYEQVSRLLESPDFTEGHHARLESPLPSLLCLHILQKSTQILVTGKFAGWIGRIQGIPSLQKQFLAKMISRLFRRFGLG